MYMYNYALRYYNKNSQIADLQIPFWLRRERATESEGGGGGEGGEGGRGERGEGGRRGMRPQASSTSSTHTVLQTHTHQVRCGTAFENTAI